MIIFFSIGSLGADKSEAEVSNVIVNRASLKGTTNGVRIKTWQVRVGLEILIFSHSTPFYTIKEIMDLIEVKNILAKRGISIYHANFVFGFL
jgi:hypothetical protein